MPRATHALAAGLAALAGCRSAGVGAPLAAQPAAPPARPEGPTVTLRAPAPVALPDVVRILVADRAELGRDVRLPLDWVRERPALGAVFAPLPVLSAREIWASPDGHPTHCYVAHYAAGAPFLEHARRAVETLGPGAHATGLLDLEWSDGGAWMYAATDRVGAVVCVRVDAARIAAVALAVLPGPLHDVAALVGAAPHLLNYEHLREEDEARAEYPLDARAAGAMRAWLPAHGFADRGGDVWIAGTTALFTVALISEGDSPARPLRVVISATRAAPGRPRPMRPLHGPAAGNERCDAPREDEALHPFEERCQTLM